MSNYLKFKTIFYNKNYIVPIIIGIFLTLTLGNIEKNFIEILNTTFLRTFNITQNQGAIIDVMRVFIHKGILIYIIITVISYEKDVYLKYELIRYKNKYNLIFKKVKYIALYIVYYYIVMFLTIYILSIILGNEYTIDIVSIKCTVYLIVKLIMLNIFYGVLALVLAIIFNSKISFISILLIDSLYIINNNNYLFNKLYYTNNLLFINAKEVIELSIIVLVLSLGLIYFMNLYSNNKSLIE